MTDKINIDRSVVEQAIAALTDLAGWRAAPLCDLLRAALEQPDHSEQSYMEGVTAGRHELASEYPLPTDLYDSKDWRCGTYAERVEWLHTMYEDAKEQIAALEQPQVEQEPVAATLAFYEGEREPRLLSWNRLPNGEHRLYTHPQNLRCKSNQKRLATLWGYVKAEPLTDEQIAAATGAKPGTPMWLVAVAFARAIEAAHNIKDES